MEGQNKCLELGFHGYDGCFPKATRSSRGRAESMKQSYGQPKDMHIFELLATVAGELLQEVKDEGRAADHRNCEDSKNAASETDRSKQIKCLDILPVEAVEQKELASTGISMLEKLSEDMKILHTCILPKAEVLHEYSMISCLEDQTNLLIPHGFDSGPTVTYSSRRRKNSEVLSCNNKKGSPASLVPFCAMLVKPEPGTPLANHFSATCMVDGHGGDMSLDGSNANARRSEDINMIIQNSFHVVDAESPPLVSSGSSEDTAPPLAESKFESAMAAESKRQEFGSQDSNGGSGNSRSSQSTMLGYMDTKPSNISHTDNRVAERPNNHGVKKQDLGTTVKRKRHRAEGVEKGNIEPRKSKGRAARNAAQITSLLENSIEQSNVPSLNIVMEAVKLLAPATDSEKASEKTANPTISSPTKSTVKTTGDHVKFSIKSFMVPELLVDLPQSATVTNLKQAVMDSAMNLLGGGLCVRVLLQGNKVVDESQSLLQAGIASDGKLGFMLEPNPMHTSMSNDDGVLVLSHVNKHASSRYPTLSKGSEVNGGISHMGSSEGKLEVGASSSGTEVKPIAISPTKQELVAYNANGMVVPTSCAVILHPGQVKSDGSNGLTVVPFGQNPVNKRRMRRPFSVAEVETLVEAVETLGTGRWRDVKLHAFSQAKHRTYVDLKDKWKTLVHTASIAPHQRRGEIVPQSLLDRVIQAHSYWTEQQAKPQSIENKMIVSL